MNIYELRQKAGREEVDYLFLKSMLHHYDAPRDKIRAYLRKQELVRVKKGLYVFGELAARGPYSRETLANLIYGPSCVSLEYALAFYGLIPERVEVLTSVTPRRNRFFDTPIGQFEYRYLRAEFYPAGIDLQEIAPERFVLIASPEKALCDVLLLRGHLARGTDVDGLAKTLEQDLRIDMRQLARLSSRYFSELARAYQSEVLRLLTGFSKRRSR